MVPLLNEKSKKLDTNPILILVLIGSSTRLYTDLWPPVWPPGGSCFGFIFHPLDGFGGIVCINHGPQASVSILGFLLFVCASVKEKSGRPFWRDTRRY